MRNFEIKQYLKNKLKQFHTKRRVMAFKKKIQKLEKHKNKMRKKNSLILSTS